VAKLFGGYSHLDATSEECGFPGLAHSVSSSLALEVLTGNTGENLVSIICEDGQWNCFNSVMEPLPWPDDLSTGPRNATELVQLLEIFDKQDCIMVADDHAKNGTYLERVQANQNADPLPLPDTHDFVKANVLVHCHTYSLIEVHLDMEGVDEADLVKMRNPWCAKPHGFGRERLSARASALWHPSHRRLPL